MLEILVGLFVLIFLKRFFLKKGNESDVTIVPLFEQDKLKPLAYAEDPDDVLNENFETGFLIHDDGFDEGNDDELLH